MKKSLINIVVNRAYSVEKAKDLLGVSVQIGVLGERVKTLNGHSQLVSNEAMLTFTLEKLCPVDDLIEVLTDLIVRLSE